MTPEIRVCASCDSPVEPEDIRCWLCGKDLVRTPPRAGAGELPAGGVAGAVAIVVTLFVLGAVSDVWAGVGLLLALVSTPGLLAIGLARQREHLRAAKATRTGRLGLAFHTAVIVGLGFALFGLALFVGLALVCGLVAIATEPGAQSAAILAACAGGAAVLGGSYYYGKKLGQRSLERRR